jgi:arylsulfatase A-like enzyme
VLDHARASGGALHFVGRRQSGNGFWVPAGEPRTVALALPSESVLTFGLALEPLLGERTGRMAAHTFRVELDGALLFEHTLTADVLGEAVSWHEVPLPAGGVRKAELRFSVEGPPALSCVVDPLVAPRERGRPGARPWREERPDVVVFLADTFRADNLAAYGSTSGLTPAIDRFAARARVYAQAWSTSPHTLPTHAALFTGHFPHQNGLVDFYNPLPGALDTLAEKLAARGYRCAAVTDGGMVSQRHGLEQGFAWFDERVEADTLARTRDVLARDDGRPLFLFVQTYAVHAPYRPSAETRARLRGSLPVDGDFDELYVEAQKLGITHTAERPAAQREREDALARELRGLYLAKTSELDESFGRFLAELDARGGAEASTLFFLSDHGEAFLEHSQLFHATGVHEEELRVPLLVRGPGFAPGREERPVSLIDFAPTVAELCGLAREPEWIGRSLRAPPAERELFGFQARRAESGATLAVIEGGKKRIGRYWAERSEVGEFQELYDLARDPGEAENLLPAPSGPSAELHARLAHYLTPLVTPEAGTLDAEDLRKMHGLGYGGGESD